MPLFAQNNSVGNGGAEGAAAPPAFSVGYYLNAMAIKTLFLCNCI